MAFLEINNILIRGMSAAVPKRTEENKDYPLFKGDEADKFMKSTGIERRHVDNTHTFLDLSLAAAEKILEDLQWKKSDVEAVILVTQNPEYLIPATSCIFQDRLGLDEECYTLDISLGCSGWVYGLSALASLGNSGKLKKMLLVAGDTVSNQTGFNDKSAYPLFGNASTVTALEYVEGAKGFKFHLATNGSGYDAIIIPDGGNRNRFTAESLIDIEVESDIIRNRTDLVLDGMNVFSFGITKPPQSIKKIEEKYELDLDSIDYFLFHQANMFMNEKIRKKLKLAEEKVPYSLRNFGNTSSASIVLTMVTELKEQLREKQLTNLGCGFGVGLSWATVYFTTDKIVCSDLVEI